MGGAMGEKRRGGQLQTDQKVPKKTAGKCVVSKEAVPVALKLRLFVGGLGPTVGASDLEQRFAPLGTVHRIDLVEGKEGWDAEEALQRGFAYVDFEASSEASLRKLFSAYSGCKWKGGVLRVEKAKIHYTDRLCGEWAEAEAGVKARIAEAEKAAAIPIVSSRPMHTSKSDDDAWGSPESNRVDLDEVIEEEGKNAADDDNTKWMQRATWKSLMDADGRATFSLKQLTGESETSSKATTDMAKTTKAAAVLEKKSFSAFEFSFSRNLPEAFDEADPKSVSVGWLEGMPKPDSAEEKNSQPVKIISEDEEAGCLFMKSANAEMEWRASKSEHCIGARAKHKLAVRKMKKMKGSRGAR